MSYEGIKNGEIQKSFPFCCILHMKEGDEHTRAMRSASTIGMSWALKRLDTVLFPDEIPPVRPTILILALSAKSKIGVFCYNIILLLFIVVLYCNLMFSRLGFLSCPYICIFSLTNITS